MTSPDRPTRLEGPQAPASLVPASLAEFIATFAFVFASSGAAVASGLGIGRLGVALATGLAFGVAIAAVAGVSGGHVNPATTLALLVAGRVRGTRALAYVLAQALGALAASLLLRALVPGFIYNANAGGAVDLSPILGAGRGIAIEATITFLLIFVYLAVMLDPRKGGSTSAGLLVGLTVAVGIIAFGPYTGAAMNPARWLGPAFAAKRWADWYVWIAGPLLGALVAAAASRALSPREEPVTSEPEG
jgi:MIP family channel proteins